LLAFSLASDERKTFENIESFTGTMNRPHSIVIVSLGRFWGQFHCL